MSIYDIAYETSDIHMYLYRVFPMVDRELKYYADLAGKIPDRALSKLASDSISLKRFHCLGGSIYSLYPMADMEMMVDFIAAYQTISDYLDNLCDRAGIQEEAAFKGLHLAMNDALIPGDIYSDYYKYYPYKNDGGYLKELIKECKETISRLPSYDVIKDKLVFLSGLYSDLQVYKHLSLNIREEKMRAWYGRYIVNYPQITGWEFAASSGSTLGIFVLVAAAFKKNLTADEADRILNAYFPSICGLHILLDYYIDYYEDIDNNDLNFVGYYENMAGAAERINYFYRNSINNAKTLEYPFFHRMVADGLIALYFSDPKADSGDLPFWTQNILSSVSMYARVLYNICKHLREKKTI